MADGGDQNPDNCQSSMPPSDEGGSPQSGQEGEKTFRKEIRRSMSREYYLSLSLAFASQLPRQREPESPTTPHLPRPLGEVARRKP